MGLLQGCPWQLRSNEIIIAHDLSILGVKNKQLVGRLMVEKGGLVRNSIKLREQSWELWTPKNELKMKNEVMKILV